MLSTLDEKRLAESILEHDYPLFVVLPRTRNRIAKSGSERFS
jgi:hypothetical protein